MANYDILIMPALSDRGDGQVTFATGDDTRATEGLQKLAQQWVIYFLTERGSQPSDLNYGTDFFATIRGSNLGDNTFVRDKAKAAIVQTQGWFNTNINKIADRPDDEKLAVAKLSDLQTPAADYIVLSVLITSVAGNSATYTIPVSLN